MPRPATLEELKALELEDPMLRGAIIVACPALAGAHHFNLHVAYGTRAEPTAVALRVYWYAFVSSDESEERFNKQVGWAEKPFPALPDSVVHKLDGEEVLIPLRHLKGIIGRVPDGRPDLQFLRQSVSKR